MIKADLLGINTLEEWYKSIVDQQEQAHGEHYCAMHNAIQECLSESKTYKELGTMQGGTAAAALFSTPYPIRVDLVDINMSRFNPHRHLFDDWCSKNNIELNVMECDSRHPDCVSEVDVLLIDSIHLRPHMESELKVHANTVQKYIIFHDTTAKLDLANGIKDFCSRINPWVLHEKFLPNVGYTVLKRVGS